MLKSSIATFKRANRIAEKASRLIAERDQAGAQSKRGLHLDTRICKLVRPGYYEHFKSSPEKPMFYLVRDVQSHVNYQLHAHAYHVSYAAQYLPSAGRWALRELLGGDGFLTPIWRTEYKGPRFTYVGDTLPPRAFERPLKNTSS
jgi:hypothetical protein